MSKPNISLVARHAGVAKSTVSRVLNGGSVSDEVRARVASVIDNLGYTPLPTARNLALGQTGCVGLVVETSQGAWFTQLLAGVEEELANRHVTLLLGSLALSGRYDAKTVATWITERRIDALVLCRPTRREKALVAAAKAAAIPMALVAPDEDFGTGDVFRSRNRDGSRELGDHLWSLGHRRFGFVGGPRESVDARDRLQGLQDALTKWGARVAVQHTRYCASYGPEGGREYADQYLRLPRDKAPTAIVCGNDTIALGFMAKVLQNGVRVPRDVSIVGFDDVPEAQLAWPGLTTARQEARAIGAAACRAVLARSEGRNGGRPSVTEFPTTLMVRQSTGPAPDA